MLWAQASEQLQIVLAVLGVVSTGISAYVAIKTIQLQTQAMLAAKRMDAVQQSVREVKAVTDGITEKLVEKAEQKGIEQGKREQIEKTVGNPPLS